MNRIEPKAPKKACNVCVREDLLVRARELGINLSQTLETALEQRLREAEAARWAEENREAIDSQNRWVAKHGMWHDRLRAR
jgi:antitoxin CcdA